MFTSTGTHFSLFTLLFCYSVYCPSLLASSLILGLSVCDGAGDWCPDGIVGKARIEQQIGKSNTFLFAEHMSQLGNGELRLKGDYGVNLIGVEYKIKLWP